MQYNIAIILKPHTKKSLIKFKKIKIIFNKNNKFAIIQIYIEIIRSTSNPSNPELQIKIPINDEKYFIACTLEKIAALGELVQHNDDRSFAEKMDPGCRIV